MTHRSILPSTWTIAKIDDLCTALQYGYTASAGTERRGPKFLRITDIQDGGVAWESVPYCEIAKDQIVKYLLHPGDIVFARTGGTVGKSYIITSVPEPSVFASYLIRVTPHGEIFPKFLYYFFQSGSYWEQVGLKKSGLQGNVNATTLSTLEIPLCPQKEQRRIVAKIDQLFSELDDGVAALSTAREQLEACRKAVLKYAFEGKLTAAWRKANRNKIEPVTSLLTRITCPPRPNRWNSRTKDIILGHAALAVGNPGTELPQGWKWCQLADIARMESGHTPSREHPEWWGGNVPWIGIADARENDGRIIKNTLQKTNESGLRNSAARLLPAGTVCISRTASVGYVVVMGKEMATSQDFVNWTPTEAVTSDWLRIVFGADKESLRRFGKGSVHKTIYFPEWLSIHIALPPVAEQKEITSRLGSQLTAIEHQSRTIEETLKMTKALRQAILKDAFCGRLVRQDPSDEPASTLLERIRASRERATIKRERTVRSGRKRAA